VRRKQHQRRLFFETGIKLANRLRDRQAVERPGSDLPHMVQQRE
jgi:hypothetical protein